MEPKVTTRDKKNDILKAYEQLVKEYNKLDSKSKQQKIADKGDNRMNKPQDEKMPGIDVEGIVKVLSDLKMDVGRTLSELSDKLVAEVENLEKIKQITYLEEQKLTEIYDIKFTAESLEELRREQKERKNAFQEEMDLLRKHWEKEQERHDNEKQQRDDDLKKERLREAEEYKYNLTLNRKRESDVYEEERAALVKKMTEERENQEKELSEREAAVASIEDELDELRGKVKSFPDELNNAIGRAREKMETQVRLEEKHKAQLLAIEVEGERKVTELKIQTLEDTIMKLDEQVKTLSKQLNDATNQVQKIATRAIEGASGIKALTAVNEIALEQAKNRQKKG